MMHPYAFLLSAVLVLLACPTTHSLIFPSLSKPLWSSLNSELSSLLSPLHSALSNDQISPSDAAAAFSSTITTLLKSKPEFSSPLSQRFITHASRALKQLKKQKKSLRKQAFSSSGTATLRSEFYQCVRLFSLLKKEEKRANRAKSASYQENFYRTSFWSFCRKCCSGFFSTDKTKPSSPTFSQSDADSFYSSRYSNAPPLDLSKLSWMPTTPNITNPFDLSPITPRTVSNILKSRKSDSSSGPDDIFYGYLKNLPCTHHFLATLFSKILASGVSPPCWSLSNVTLIHKSGSTSDPVNFRMIALSSAVGKTFHLILASRFQSFLLTNKLIDPTLQKAFLSGINGCIEHCTVLNSLLLHARKNKKNSPLHLVRSC